jgi:hypothetical protein
MRRCSVAFVACVVLASVPASAQETPQAPCQSVDPVRVTVTTVAGPTLRGTLLCLSGTDVVLAADGNVTSTALADVRRIDTRPDPVWDGAVKGAVLPLVVWLVFCPECDAGPMLRTAAGYATIGIIWDSLDTNRTRIYDRRPAAAIRWRVRF